MRNAYECKEEYGRGGKCVRRERVVGAIVPWSIVAILALWLGNAWTVPSSIWQVFKP
jgi:hypothetical protein